MSGLASAVVSITKTARRRYFWAAWWTATPRYAPFQKPDASNGGAPSIEAALADAEQAAGRHLTHVEAHWAHAWNRVLRGEKPEAPKPRAPRDPARAAPANSSAWSILGIENDASASEIKRAFRKRALETHPDQGGDAEEFRRVQRAYERLTRGKHAKRG